MALAFGGAFSGLLSVGAGSAVADDDWKPFAEIDRRREKERAAARQRLSPEERQTLPSFNLGEEPWRQGRSSNRTGAAGEPYPGAPGSSPLSRYATPSDRRAAGAREPYQYGYDSNTVRRTELAPPPSVGREAAPQFGTAPRGRSAAAPSGEYGRRDNGIPGGWQASPRPDGSGRAGWGSEPSRRVANDTRTFGADARDPNRARPTAPPSSGWQRDTLGGGDRRASPRFETSSSRDGRSASVSGDVFKRLISQVPLPAASPTTRAILAELLADGRLISEGGEIATLARLTHLEAGLPIASNVRPGAETSQGLAAFIAAKAALARGDDRTACATIKSALSNVDALQTPAKGQAIAVGGFCAMQGGDMSGGKLAAGLAREAGGVSDLTAYLLENGGAAPPRGQSKPRSVTLIDLRLMALVDARPEPAWLEKLTPPAMAYAARYGTRPLVRVAVAEAAAKKHLIETKDLADAYEAAGNASGGAQNPQGPFGERVAIWASLRQARDDRAQYRDLRALMTSARQSRLGNAMLRTVAAPVSRLRADTRETAFAELAVAALLSGGRPREAQAWIGRGRDAGAGSRTLSHWGPLAAIADPEIGPARGSSALAALSPLVAQGAFSPAALHRLATVLDALNYNVPIDIWDAANRTRQPTGGFLPPTGTVRLGSGCERL
ncbi:MAG: hypothetical protein AAFO62_01020, partial [Pseudomonadota bacterium]